MLIIYNIFELDIYYQIKMSKISNKTNNQPNPKATLNPTSSSVTQSHEAYMNRLNSSPSPYKKNENQYFYGSESSRNRNQYGDRSGRRNQDGENQGSGEKIGDELSGELLRRIRQLESQNYKLESINKTNDLRLELIGNKILQIQKQKQYIKKQNQRLQSRIEVLQNQLQIERLKKDQAQKQHNQQLKIYQQKCNRHGLLKIDYKKLEEQNRELKEKLYAELKSNSREQEKQFDSIKRSNVSSNRNETGFNSHREYTANTPGKNVNVSSFNNFTQLKYKVIDDSNGKQQRNMNKNSNTNPVTNTNTSNVTIKTPTTNKINKSSSQGNIKNLQSNLGMSNKGIKGIKNNIITTSASNTNNNNNNIEQTNSSKNTNNISYSKNSVGESNNKNNGNKNQRATTTTVNTKVSR